jgi:hypothetical protein
MMKISIEFYFYCTNGQALRDGLVKAIASLAAGVGPKKGGTAWNLLTQCSLVTI